MVHYNSPPLSPQLLNAICMHRKLLARFPTFSAICSCRVHMSMRFGLPMRHCQCGVWKHITLCGPTCFLFFFKIVNVECERMLHFVTRIDVEMLKKTSHCIFKCAFKRHTFSRWSLGIIWIANDFNDSGSERHKATMRKRCKIHWQSPMTFRRDVFDQCFDQANKPKSSM